MNVELPLSSQKKLTAIFRLEPGCLGPNGRDIIDIFCQKHQKEIKVLDTDFIQWQLVPRHNKLLPEIQYIINNKNLPQDKATIYFKAFNQNIDDVEANFHKKIACIIELYFK